jgi:nucleoid DNA-binding protein
MTKVCKGHLARLVSERAGVSLGRARELLSHVFDAITQELARGNSVTMSGFGTWRMKVCPPRSCHDLHSGRQVTVPPRTRVGFRAGAGLRRAAETSIESEVFYGEGVACTTELDTVFAKLFGVTPAGLERAGMDREEVVSRIAEALDPGADREAAEFFQAMWRRASKPDEADKALEP